MGGLAAVAAILGAPAGLDGQKPAALDGVGVEVAPVHALGAEQEIIEGSVVESLGFFARPIMTQFPISRLAGRARLHRRQFDHLQRLPRYARRAGERRARDVWTVRGVHRKI